MTSSKKRGMMRPENGNIGGEILQAHCLADYLCTASSTSGFDNEDTLTVPEPR